MKQRFLLTFLLFTLIGFNISGQSSFGFIKVMVKSGHLNLREYPSTDSHVLAQLNVDSQVAFEMKIQDGWLQVKHYVYDENDIPRGTVGWVHSDYVDAPFLRSTILQPIKSDHDGTLVESVEGYVAVLGQDNNGIIQLDGKIIDIHCTDEQPHVFEGGGVKIEFITYFTELGYEYIGYTGFMRVSQGNKVEYVFVNAFYGA